VNRVKFQNAAFWRASLKPFDETGTYDPQAGGRELHKLAIRGAGVTIFSSGLGVAIQIIATITLARLLMPADFGLVAMVTTFSLLPMNFGLNGFTEAILQRETLDDQLASNLFWINLGIGAALTVCFAAAGTLLAKFYHNPLVAHVSVGVSVTILLTSVSVVHFALLKRAMRFFEASAIEIFARVASLAISILLAWAGWGYWALVAGVIAVPLLQSLGAWWVCSWTPRLPRRAAGTASMVWFALNVYGRFSFNYSSRNMDNILVGWRFGSVALGFYKKAYDLFALAAGQLSSPLTNVAVAALSRVDPRSPRYREFLCGGISVMALVGMALGGELTLLGPQIIRILLGPGWEETGRIFTFFGPGIGVMVIYYISGWIHLSIGTPARWLRWSLVEVAVTGLLFLLALPWGAVGIAVAWTSSFWLLIVPAFWYAGRPIGLGVKPILAATWKYVVAGVGSGCACGAISHSLRAVNDMPAVIQRIMTISSLFAALYALAVILLHRGLEPVYLVVGLLRRMVSNGEGDARLTPTSVPVPGLVEVDSAPRNKPRVSILIPAYNSEEWIADTLRCALAQTWEPKEIIVVDDGSLDRTLAIAREFESSSVRVVTQRNQGAAAARNTAYALSSGDYIQWLDADDLLAPDKVSKQMELVEAGEGVRTLLSSSFALFKYRFYRAQFVPGPLWCDLSSVEWLIRKLGLNTYMQTATWLVSRELTEAAGPWDTSLLGDDDGEYFCRVLLASDGVRFVPDSKVFYRAPWVGTLSYLGRQQWKLKAHWHSMELHIRYLRSLEDSERVQRACVRYLENCLVYFYPEMPEVVEAAQTLAHSFGSELKLPRLSWKYSWIRKLAGWRCAKRAQILVPRLRWAVMKMWEKTMFIVETRLLVIHSPFLEVEAARGQAAWRSKTVTGGLNDAEDEASRHRAYLVGKRGL
jgi:O-antigen/teichoic acid export membrane protein/glycosyltransferase involved in cell wall biosynthesis